MLTLAAAGVTLPIATRSAVHLLQLHSAWCLREGREVDRGEDPSSAVFLLRDAAAERFAKPSRGAHSNARMREWAQRTGKQVVPAGVNHVLASNVVHANMQCAGSVHVLKLAVRPYTVPGSYTQYLAIIVFVKL